MANNINNVITQGNGPSHIAFIMDGNGRWATMRGKPREFGHKAGAEAFKRVLQKCGEMKLKAATFYVFSTENWKRPEKEVSAILKLLDSYLDRCEKEMEKRDIRFIFIGDKSVFSPKLREKMIRVEERSKDRKYIANLAINYGGRSEIAHAVNELIASGASSVEEEDISGCLYTKDSPPVDMIVRTGGDLRISNFLLWQAAYAELYFTDKLWPDMTPEDVDVIVEEFNKRKRRFGGI